MKKYYFWCSDSHLISENSEFRFAIPKCCIAIARISLTLLLDKGSIGRNGELRMTLFYV